MVCISCSSLLNGGRPALELAGPLDVDGVVPVDHDLADAGVVEDRLEHTQPDRLVDHAPHQLVAFARRQDDALAGDEVGDDALEPGPSLVGIDLAELVEVDLLEEHAPEGDDEAVVLLGRRGDGPRR
jgi:hypothetical protein